VDILSFYNPFPHNGNNLFLNTGSPSIDALPLYKYNIFLVWLNNPRGVSDYISCISGR